MNSIRRLFSIQFQPANRYQAPQAQEEQSRPLMDENGDKTEQSNFRSRSTSKLWSRRVLLPCPTLLITIFFSALLGAAVVGIAGLHHPDQHQPRPAPAATGHHHQTGQHDQISTDTDTNTSTGMSSVMVQPCGNTTAEARARGCHFDVISFCWLPDACYDAELSAEFLAAHELEWFEDPAKERPLSYEQIITGEHTGLYVNWEYHVAHCTAMWRKMHRAILGALGKAAIDAYIGSYPHTEHCEQMLLGGTGVAFDTINTRIAVKYPDCGIA